MMGQTTWAAFGFRKDTKKWTFLMLTEHEERVTELDESNQDDPDSDFAWIAIVGLDDPPITKEQLEAISTVELPEEDEPPIPEYDPGPEVDDEGGMSEYRNHLPGDYD